jgi:hypothetical protein
MPRVQPGKSVFTRLVSCWLIMYKTWFFFSTIVFCLSFIGGDETIILVKKYYIVLLQLPVATASGSTSAADAALEPAFHLTLAPK